MWFAVDSTKAPPTANHMTYDQGYGLFDTG